MSKDTRIYEYRSLDGRVLQKTCVVPVISRLQEAGEELFGANATYYSGDSLGRHKSQIVKVTREIVGEWELVKCFDSKKVGCKVMDFIDKYFNSHREYPRNVAFDPLPMGTYWEHISTTFLNGFINYVEVKAAVVLNRYLDWTDPLEHEPVIKYENRGMTPYGFNWDKFSGTKQELYDYILNNKHSIYHTKIHLLEDDVILLAKVPESENTYMVFWFDRDCSDSSIGRFQSDVPFEQILIDFKEWALNLKLNYKEDTHKELPLHFFQGWIHSQ